MLVTEVSSHLECSFPATIDKQQLSNDIIFSVLILYIAVKFLPSSYLTHILLPPNCHVRSQESSLVVGALDQNMLWGGTEEHHSPTII